MPSEWVYHASPVQGLKVLRPRPSTHGRSWVYATIDPVMAALFVSPIGGDLTCQVGRDPETGAPYVCERFRGAFEHRYAGRSGSIYTLPAGRFLSGQTSWEEEVVSEEAVVPVGEVRIADARAYLLELAAAGELLIVRYPRRIDGIPEDDEDLVDKVAQWARQLGPGVLEQLKAYHPHLLGRVVSRLQAPGEEE
ncbi:MAG TPA: hypothetical protein DGR79_08135 [Clostridiales bacterium]|nr:hypothetical protein [Clostridiales bacterium]